MEAPTGAMWLPQHVCRLMHPNILKLEHPQNSPTFTPKSWIGLVKMMFSFEQNRLFSGSNAIDQAVFLTTDWPAVQCLMAATTCWCQEEVVQVVYVNAFDEAVHKRSFWEPLEYILKPGFHYWFMVQVKSWMLEMEPLAEHPLIWE